MKRIDMYINHDRSVGGLFLEYIGVYCVKPSETKCTRRDLRVKKKEKNASVVFGHCGFVFTRFTLDGRVGHDLVLVFAATRRRMALRAARVIEHAGPPCCFFPTFQFFKPSYTV